MQIYFKTRQASREFAQKRRANGKPASVVDAGKGWGQLRYSVSLKSSIDKRIASVK